MSKTWKISQSKYKTVFERDIKIRMSNGTEMNADISRFESEEKFPAIFGYLIANVRGTGKSGGKYRFFAPYMNRQQIRISSGLQV